MMAKKPRSKEDPLRRMLQGILSLVLTTLAAWLAAKLVERLLGPLEKEAEEKD
jgi:hypothetical protein